MPDVPSRASSTAPLETETEEETEEEETEEEEDEIVVVKEPPIKSSRKSIKSSRNSARSLKVEPLEPLDVEPMDVEEPSSKRDMEQPPSRRPVKANNQNRNPILPKSWWVRFFIALAIIVVLLIIILVPLGYNELEYYEMGFHHNLATGYVDTSKVYYGGRHWVGVNADFIKYPSTLLRECYHNVSIYNKEKMEISLSFCFTYQLRYEDLKSLHETYGNEYQPIIRSASLAAVKGAAVKHSMYEFRRKRTTVAEGLEAAVALTIGGKCCRKDRVKYKTGRHCIEYWKCDKNRDIGYFSALRNFQLHRIYVTTSQSEQFLKQVIEKEIEDTFRFQQEEKLVRMYTEQLELEYSSGATQIAQNASAESSRIKLAAVSEAESVVEYYRNQGLRHVFDALNVTEEEYKKSLDYVITLRNQNKANLYLGFQYMVANPVSP